MGGPGHEDRALNRAAIVAGGMSGLAVIVPLVGVQLVATAVSDDEVPGGVVALLFLGILLAFGLAGARAGRRAPDAPATHGALAAVVALVAWVPLRLAIAVAGDGGNPVAGIGAAAGFALVMGTLGGLFGARKARP